MSKTKQIISMVLVAVMVMTMCPMGAPLSVTAADDLTWSTPASAPAGVSAVVTGTKVIRVAYGPNSYLYGTTVVAATEDGIPYSNGTYANLGYAGLSHNLNEMTPRVSITLGTPADGIPDLTVTSMSGWADTNISFINISASNGNKTFTYDYDINKDGGLHAQAGDTLLYTFTYSIDGTEYKTYYTANVRELQSPMGKSSYLFKKNGWGSTQSRLGHVFTIQGNGLYGRIGYSPDNNGWGTTGTVGNTTSMVKSNDRVQLNWNCANLSRSPSTDQSNCLVSGTAGNVQWPSIFSNETVKELGANAEEFYRHGWADDENRSRGDIYIDRSALNLSQDVATQLNLRYAITRIDGINSGSWGRVSLNAYHVTVNKGGDTSYKENDWSDYDHSEDEYSHFRMYTRWNDSTSFVTIQETDNLGGQLVVPITGDLYTGSTANISANADYADRGNPVRISMTASVHSNAVSSYSVGVTFGLDMYVYVTDKSDLRNVLNVISGGQASCTLSGDTNITQSKYSSGSFTPAKGVNPQASAFTADSYNAFKTAYQNACKVYTDGKSYNQIAIAEATRDVISAYNGLQRLSNTAVARLYLEGTTTPVPGSNAAGYASSSYYAGDTATFTAPAAIGGYSRISPAEQSVTITGAAQPHELVFYYRPATYTYTFDPVEVDAGGNNGDGVTGVKTKNVTFGQTYTLSSYAPAFVYNGYTITGWYESYNRTTGEYSNKLSDSYKVEAVGSKTLYAKWELAPVVLHYNVDMAGQTIADRSLMPGESLAGYKPADPDYEGYTFGGWYADQSFATPFDWSATVAQPYVNGQQNPGYKSEITAYAKFTTFGGMIVFEENGGDTIDDINLTNYADNAVVTLPRPERMGYSFAGWYTKSDFSGSQCTQVTATPAMKVSGIGLYAKWEPKTFVINFNIKYNAATASPVDSTTNPASINAKVGENVTEYCAATHQTLPGAITRYGYDFKGWTNSTSSRNQEFINIASYNSAVSNGYRYDLEESTAVFQATDSEVVTLYPMWVKNTNNAYINLDAYKMMSGEAVPVSEAEISTGDIVTVRMTATANFFTGSSTFVYMYDNNFFELLKEGTEAFTLNEENDYISAINGTADYFGYTDSDVGLVPSGVTYPAGTSASDYNWMQISIDPDVENGYVSPGASEGGSYMVQFKLRVKATAAGSKGIVFMDNAWTRTQDNNGGTMYFGCCATSSAKVWESYNNIVTPDLTFATSTVTLQPSTSRQTTVTLNPNGGTWPDDSSTGTKSYTGDEEEEILNYAGTPSKFGYIFKNFAKEDDPTDVWAEGYYATYDNNNATYFAQWDGVEVINTFKYNDGTDNGTEVASQYGSAIAVPEEPTRTGYDFAGWSVDDQATTGTTDLGTQSSIEGTTYYAVWTPKANTPFKITVQYTNNQTGAQASQSFPAANKTNYAAIDGSTVDAFGTTGAEIHIVPDADHQENTATDVYIKYSELPKVANGNYIFDVENPSNMLDAVIAADGSTTIVLNYTGKLYTITFDANEGAFTVPSPASVIDTTKPGTYGEGKGEGYAYTADKAEFYMAFGKRVNDVVINEDTTKNVLNPTRTGYTFGGWGTSATATAAFAWNTNMVSASKDTTYYAIWNGINVTNTFNANNGSFEGGVTVTKDSVYGKAISTPDTNPERAGFTFLGWAASPSATDKEDLGNQESTTGTTFYAVWKLNDQTYNIDVYYMGTDGQYGEKDACSTTATGSGLVSVDPAAYAADGFTYSAGDSVVSVTLDESTVGTTKTLVVKYARNKYNVTYKVDGEVYGAVDSVYWGAELITREEPEKTGYTFSGWTKDGAVVPAAMPKEAITLSGTFTINSYTLTVNYYYPDGTTPIAPAHSESVNYEAGYSVTSPTVEGYTPETATVTGNMPADNKVVNVKYTINAIPLTIHYKYSTGAKAAEDYTGNVNYHAEYSVTSPTITGYTADKTVVSGVMGATAVEETVTYTVNSHDLIINYVYEGGATAATQYKVSYNYGQAYSVSSPEITGYTADKLIVSGNMEDADKTVTVTYKANKYKLTITYTGAGEATPAVYEKEFTYGDPYSVTSPAVTGYTPDVATVAGDMPAKAVDVTVTYKVNSYLLTVHYQYEDGKEAAPDHTESVNYEATYTVISPSVTGYTADTATVTGTMGAEPKTVTVTYSVDSYTLTIHFVDKDGAALADDATYPVNYNASYSYSAAEVTGYTPTKKTVTGTMPAQDKEETVTYDINSYALIFAVPKLLADGTLSTVNAADPTTYTIVSSTVVEYKSAVNAPKARDIENYEFKEWNPAVPQTMGAADAFYVGTYERVEVTLAVAEESKAAIDDSVEDGNTIDGYIYGVANCLTVAAFEESYMVVSGNGHIEVTPAYNYQKFGIVGTGTKVELVDDVTNTVIETYYVVLYGDLNGDGFCDNIDVAMMREEIMTVDSVSILDGSTEGCWAADPAKTAAPQMKAGDLNGNGSIDSDDLAKIKDIAGFRAEIDQATRAITYYGA